MGGARETDSVLSGWNNAYRVLYENSIQSNVTMCRQESVVQKKSVPNLLKTCDLATKFLPISPTKLMKFCKHCLEKLLFVLHATFSNLYSRECLA